MLTRGSLGTIKFASWASSTCSIRDSWVMLMHPTLKYLHIEFPPDHDRLCRLPRSIQDLDVNRLNDLRGTTKLRTLHIIDIPDASILTPLLTLPRQLDHLQIYADTFGPLPSGIVSHHPLECLSPLYDTLLRLEIGTCDDIFGDDGDFDDADLRPFHLAKFKAVVELYIPVRQTRSWRPEDPNLFAPDDFDGLAALLPPRVEKLTFGNWGGWHTGPWFRGLPDNGLSRVMAFAEGVAAAWSEERRLFGGWNEVAFEVAERWPHDRVTVPRDVVSALVRIGLDVWVKRCGIVEGKLELLPSDSSDFVVELSTEESDDDLCGL